MVGRSAADIERALLRKGFVYTDTHHRYLHHMRDSLPTGIRTKLSHGIHTYGASLLAGISRQLRITKAELLQLIDCEMGAEEYVAVLVERGVLDP